MQDLADFIRLSIDPLSLGDHPHVDEYILAHVSTLRIVGRLDHSHQEAALLRNVPHAGEPTPTPSNPDSPWLHQRRFFGLTEPANETVALSPWDILHLPDRGFLNIFPNADSEYDFLGALRVNDDWRLFVYRQQVVEDLRRLWLQCRFAQSSIARPQCSR
jgi:hypothetical protein